MAKNRAKSNDYLNRKKNAKKYVLIELPILKNSKRFFKIQLR